MHSLRLTIDHVDHVDHVNHVDLTARSTRSIIKETGYLQYSKKIAWRPEKPSVTLFSRENVSSHFFVDHNNFSVHTGTIVFALREVNEVFELFLPSLHLKKDASFKLCQCKWCSITLPIWVDNYWNPWRIQANPFGNYHRYCLVLIYLYSQDELWVFGFRTDSLPDRVQT